jgi:hypothetical protein
MAGAGSRSGGVSLLAMLQKQEPAQAVTHVLGVFGVPCVDVGLVAGSHAALALCEPVEEHRGLGDLLAGEFSAGWGDRLVLGAGSKFGQDFPGGKPVDELGVSGVGDGVEVGDEPAFEQADLLVDARQDVTSHEQLTQMRGGPPGLQGVKRLVGQRDLSPTELP